MATALAQVAKCATCYVPGHTADHCTACRTCYRPGHPSGQCPFRNSCSNCGQHDHRVASCNVGCQVPGCGVFEWTWLHPHHATSISLANRAHIHGTNKVPRDPAVTHSFGPGPPVHHQALAQLQNSNTPNTDYATYNRQPADQQFMPQGHTGASVVTNYVALNKTPKQIHVYSVVYSKVPVTNNNTATATNPPPPQYRDITKRSEKARIFSRLAQLAPLSGRDDWTTDYTFIWSRNALFNHPTVSEHILHNVVYSKQSGHGLTVPTVRYRHLRTLSLANDPAALVGAVDDTTGHNPMELTVAFNGLVTKYITQHPQRPLEQVGANQFFLKGSWQDLNGIYVNRGYFSSIRPGSSKVLLNVNAMHKAFYAPLTVPEFLDIMSRRQFVEEYGEPEALLKGRTVRIMYSRPTIDNGRLNVEANRKKVIAGFGDIPQRQQFIVNGHLTTVQEFFESQGATIRQPDKRCVNVGLKTKVPENDGDCDQSRELWIPAEFLELEPFQPFSRQLNSTHMQAMLRIALKHPADNQALITEEGLPLLGVGNPLAGALDQALEIQTGSGLLQIPVKMLAAPMIRYRNVSQPNAAPTWFDIQPQLASWNLDSERVARAPPKDKIFANPAPIQVADDRPPACVLDLRNGGLNNEKTAEEVGLSYIQALQRHGMIARGTVLNAGHVRTTRKQLPAFQKTRAWALLCKQILESAKTEFGHPKHILVILNDEKAAIYAAVKRTAEVELGTRTICVTRGKLRGNVQPSLFSNLALKRNIKSAGTNHNLVASGASPFENLAKTLVLGADVVHPGGLNPSIAALVASTDGFCYQFRGSIRLQPAGVEIFLKENMVSMAQEAITAWAWKNGALPAHILYYRDGVGEDQYHDVLDQEVQYIRRAFSNAHAIQHRINTLGVTADNVDERFKITVVVVGKRHNTRFFAPNDSMSYPDASGQRAANNANPKQANNRGKMVWPNAVNGNIRPGLLVDQVITMPQNAPGAFKDFYLQSHAALAGTAKSAHYVVLQNDNEQLLSFDRLQNVTHAFCYNYARATKGVSYCAPAYYADRLCDRAHHYLKAWLAMDENRSFKATDEEKRAGDAGMKRCKQRIRDEIANDPTWHQNRDNPWQPSVGAVMFWL